MEQKLYVINILLLQEEFLVLAYGVPFVSIFIIDKYLEKSGDSTGTKN